MPESSAGSAVLCLGEAGDRFFACILQTLGAYKSQLAEDPIVNAHLKTLYDNLLEQNLCRIIEPFSKVQVQHVANLIKLPVVCVCICIPFDIHVIFSVLGVCFLNEREKLKQISETCNLYIKSFNVVVFLNP